MKSLLQKTQTWKDVSVLESSYLPNTDTGGGGNGNFPGGDGGGGSVWPIGHAMKSCSMLQNRKLADPSFLFKVGTEIVIDTVCATFAEVQKRGKDCAEFELYAADMLVGVAVNVSLVSLLAPYARIGQPSMSQGFIGRLQRSYGALPSSVFEAERPGCRFSLNQRIAAYFYKECQEIGG
ncbi:hypothetical protein K7X08_037833 [Anisodus acutangulus]|uniref:Uncharacterized protein n=1 Tax=Anisodus acutangulus TaxID=402998 RepID=A0A9Q1MXD0_9SOLA|nr:hypothetical protein K7X08_037833 [Anisodus acutangulus]